MTRLMSTQGGINPLVISKKAFLLDEKIWCQQWQGKVRHYGNDVAKSDSFGALRPGMGK